MIHFGRTICNDAKSASSREWLITNGIGGFCSGTISSALTRRYHGLLFAALKPPLGRTLIIPKVEEIADYRGNKYHLTTNDWGTGQIDPKGCQYIEQFYLEGKRPVWIYDLEGLKLKKTVWMQRGENITFLEYQILQPSHLSLKLEIDILINARDYHGITRANSLNISNHQIQPSQLSIEMDQPSLVIHVRSTKGNFKLINQWKSNYFLTQEHQRGESASEDHILAARLSLTLEDKEALKLAFATVPLTNLDFDSSPIQFKNHEAEVLLAAEKTLGRDAVADEQICQLILAADQFIVDRTTQDNPHGKTIIAGYHWFSDWGRDTMISLPGLTLATNRPHIAKGILRTFARYLDQGLLPNRFPDVGEDPEYNTVDATLWYFEAIRSYLAFTQDIDFLIELFPHLQQIINFHLEGTRYKIKVDSQDHLLHAGEPGYQLTWMDVKIGDWVVTPRIGKPVEINALWYNALRCMAEFARQIGVDPAFYDQVADQCQVNFYKFWNTRKNCLYDVIDGPNGNDPSIRPNQIIAISSHYSPLSEQQARMVLECCTNALLIPYGLRSLAPDEPDYDGYYRGNRLERDSVYHQGTAWCWLIGPYLSAHLRLYKDPSKIITLLQPLLGHLSDYGLGSIGEITDGDNPHLPNGCISQAWSVAEVLRVIYECS